MSETAQVTADVAPPAPAVSQHGDNKVPRTRTMYVIAAAAVGFIIYLGVLFPMRIEVRYEGRPVPTKIKHHPLHKAGMGGYVLMTSSAIMGHYGIQQICNAVLAGDQSYGFVVPMGQKVGWMVTGITTLLSLVVVFCLWKGQPWAQKAYLVLLALSIVALLLDAFTTVLPNPLPEVQWEIPGSADAIFMHGLIIFGCAIVFYFVQGGGFKASLKS